MRTRQGNMKQVILGSHIKQYIKMFHTNVSGYTAGKGVAAEEYYLTFFRIQQRMGWNENETRQRMMSVVTKPEIREEHWQMMKQAFSQAVVV